MRKAVIDLGTNTFNLLIADVVLSQIQILHSEKDGVAIGMGGINQDVLAPDAMDRGMICLKKFADTCKKYKVERIFAFGTSALRGAKNTQDFVERVKSELGISIRIISGEEEAALIYYGVKSCYYFEEPSVIMDIGGGSTEFIWANSHDVTDMLSLDIGVSRMYQGLTLSDPLTQDDIVTVRNWLEDHSKSMLNNRTAEVLIGASGTFETFYELIYNKSYPSNSEGTYMDLDAIKKVCDWLVQSTLLEREQHPNIIPIRRKMAPIAALKVLWVLEKVQPKKFYLSPCALKEGALVKG